MRVLITGITGFIGKRLFEILSKNKEYEIIGMARNKAKAEFFQKKGIEIRFADLSKHETLKNLTKDVDVVVHLAAYFRIRGKWDLLKHRNVEATKVLVEDAIKNDVKHFINTSTTEAIGPVENPPADEKTECNPVYDYGRSKLKVEEFLNNKYNENGFPVTILRPSGVYGAEDRYITQPTINAVYNGKLRFLPNEGKKLIHFTYVDDVVLGYIKTIEKEKKVFGETFIICSDDYHSYKETFTFVSKKLDVPTPDKSVPFFVAKGYLRFTKIVNDLKRIDDFILNPSVVDDMKYDRAYSNKKAKDLLGFKPKFSYKEGISRTVEDLKTKNFFKK